MIPRLENENRLQESFLKTLNRDRVEEVPYSNSVIPLTFFKEVRDYSLFIYTYSVHCTPYSNILYLYMIYIHNNAYDVILNIHCTLYTVQCTVYIVFLRILNS